MDDSRVLETSDKDYRDWIQNSYKKTGFVFHLNPTESAFNYWMSLPDDTDFYNLMVCVEKDVMAKNKTFITINDIKMQYESQDSLFNSLNKSCPIKSND
jgi:hypothetical protein